MNKLFFLLLFPFGLFSQMGLDSLEIEVLKQSLPQYLDQNPNSPASYLEGNRSYKLMTFWLGFESDIMPKDSLKIEENDKFGIKIQMISDSIEKGLKTNKINVVVSDTIFAYKYIARSYEDYRKEEDWKENAEILKKEFKEDFAYRLDNCHSSRIFRSYKSTNRPKKAQ